MLLLSIVWFLAGCSDDNSNPVILEVGDSSDAEFKFIDSLLDSLSLFDSYLISLNVSIALLDSIPLPAKSSLPMEARDLVGCSDANVTITAITDYTFTGNNWHVFEFDAAISGIELSDSLEFHGTDSIQLLSGGVPNEADQVLSFDQMKVRFVVDLAGADTDDYDLAGSAHQRLDILPSDPNGNMLISAIVADTLQALQGEAPAPFLCTLFVADNYTIEDLLFETSAGSGDCCALAGTGQATLDIDLNCYAGLVGPMDPLGVGGRWVITFAVNSNRTISWTYSDESTLWSVVKDIDECSSRF